jgi:hypothetical protein
LTLTVRCCHTIQSGWVNETTTTTTTTTTPAPQAAVGGIAVLGLIAFGLGAVLLIAGRRRRAERTDGNEV